MHHGSWGIDYMDPLFALYSKMRAGMTPITSVTMLDIKLQYFSLYILRRSAGMTPITSIPNYLC